ncbi:MAG: response regulator [Nitrospiraceae bacterium]|nr:response regulator [Nitrospiraceae bacterium]
MKTRILIVEGESITAMCIADVLDSWGYDVCDPAITGADALRAADTLRPGLAILNVKLRGGMNGIELAARLIKDFGIPVVFISGYADSETRRQAEDAGAAGYLLKPVDLELLSSVLEQALQGLQETK